MKYPLLLSDVNESSNISTDVSKILKNIKLDENLSSGS
jgi:hypothetical protein